MKWRLILVGFMSIMFSMASINAQTILISYKPRQIHFDRLSTPKLWHEQGNFSLMATSEGLGAQPFSVIYKSPVHYTAFFCKMEVNSMNSLGIMIKLHAGDYDNYSGEVRYNHYKPQ